MPVLDEVTFIARRAGSFPGAGLTSTGSSVGLSNGVAKPVAPIVDHHTYLCPSMQQSEAIEQPEAYATNIYNRPPQPQQQNQPQQNNYDLSNNKYNPGWRNHPNLRWSNPSQQQQ